jgi:hypothetical protein
MSTGGNADLDSAVVTAVADQGLPRDDVHALVAIR